MAKVQISIDDNLLDRLDKYAKQNYMSRSGLISMACASYLNSNEALTAIQSMSVALKRIADEGSVDDATMKELEDFQRICQVIAR